MDQWKRGFLVFWIMMLCIDASVRAASFECQKASTLVEIMICGNPDLSRLDEQMYDAYRNLISRSASPDEIKRNQVQWLSNNRNICQNIACLDQAYRSRISALSNSQQQAPRNPPSGGYAPSQNIEDSFGRNAKNRQVILVNKSGISICKFFASRSDINSWQEDILGNNVLSSGYSVPINVDDGSGACVYDFKTVSCDGAEVVRQKVNVCEISTYTLQ
jgi:uncharacterized protein